MTKLRLFFFGLHKEKRILTKKTIMPRKGEGRR